MGLKPDEVLDMSLDVLNAYIQGYSDHMFDLQILGVQQGYYAGYYSRAKKPQSIKSVVKKLVDSRSRRKKKSTSVEKPSVDIEAFQAMDAQFKARYKQLHES